MQLLPHERVLLQGQEFPVTITTSRVRYQFGRTIKSIMLEHVTSCRMDTVDIPILLMIAILLGAAGFVLLQTGQQNESFGAFCLMVSLVFAILYATIRRSVLVICSPTEKINAPISKQNLEFAKEFLHQLEAAIDDRYLGKTEESDGFEYWTQRVS